MLRPAPLHLRLTRRDELPAGPRPAIIAFEDLHPPRIGGEPGRASGQKSRKPRKEHVTKTAMEKDYAVERDNDFMRKALEKTAA